MSPSAHLAPLKSLLEPVSSIARDAARKILEVYESDFAVAEKEDRSPLTEADLRSHHSIVAGLERLTPGVPVLSEESVDIPFAERARWAQYWLVDPLDGTKEFVKKNGEFTVNIALIVDHRPVMGIVQVPVTGHCYFAAAGVGAFKQVGDGPAEPLCTRRSDAARLSVIASRSHAGDALSAFLERLPGQVELLSKGSSLKLCLVAEGRADIYPRLGLTSEWDTAAAQAVVEQAGGQLVTLEFEPLRYNTKESLLNPHFLVIGDPQFDWRPYF